ncbi:MAG: glutamine--tRNA ligase/YqeY domain fusion protein [Coxiellaceae bacterium]|nr:glutamine--tRNA ligase/YqeY domain fusion protein [Coxiellaceae bacterium]
MTAETTSPTAHFIEKIISEDLAQGKHDAVLTRFPPEPNGYLHLGHVKSICLNFGIAKDFKGACNLRFDDTNPEKEEQKYVDAMQADIEWLGFEWQQPIHHASDYFQQLYEAAVELIKQGRAYVCDLNAEQTREYRGTLKQPGKNSPFRDRTVEENLALFDRMKSGECEEGSHVLRAKIDMSSGNMNMRDPVIYRIRHLSHQRTGDTWCIYPMYDYTHCMSDAIEAITHSLCTLEFQDHRPLYEWFLEQLNMPSRPQQIEFSRLNVSHTITSKRKLRQLVDDGFVNGWDDPRMPTLIGMRRRGYPAAALRNFCDQVGISKSDSVIDMGVMEECVRDELNRTAPRVMAVLDPIKVVITNYPEDQTEMVKAPNHPQDEPMGVRELPFSRTLYIERDDFMEVSPNKKFKRLAIGKEVRLRNAYVICGDKMITDAEGNVTEVHCTYDADTLGKNPEDGRKVKGVIHWVSAEQAVPAEVRLYDRLFTVDNPAAQDDFTQHVNSDSFKQLSQCWLEPSIKDAKPGDTFQFERTGYFVIDQDASPDQWVFNRVVSLRDSWSQ